MSKRLLTLIRHAEAGAPHGSRIADHNRPLTERGRRDASRLGALLSSRGFMPDCLWSSDAERAQTTARILGQAIALSDSELDIRSGLYLAHMGTLCDAIREASDDLGHLVLVGHNPGLSELWDWLCDKQGFGLPTCGIARLELDLSRWSQLERGCAHLVEFDRPEPASVE